MVREENTRWPKDNVDSVVEIEPSDNRIVSPDERFQQQEEETANDSESRVTASYLIENEDLKKKVCRGSRSGKVLVLPHNCEGLVLGSGAISIGQFSARV